MVGISARQAWSRDKLLNTENGTTKSSRIHLPKFGQ
jgi:hypothetical protein